MNYKIVEGSDLYAKMIALNEKCIECNRKSTEWVESNFGEGVNFARPGYYLAGGLAGIELNEKPDNYKQVGKPWQNLFAPYAKNKKVSKEWANLPVVRKEEVRDVLNYGNYSGASVDGFRMNTMPGLFFTDGVILVEASTLAKSYVPVDGMIEILRSEFEKIKESAAQEVAQ